jgi:hypothetical protein
MMNHIDPVMQELWAIKDKEVEQFGSIANYVKALQEKSYASSLGHLIAEPSSSLRASITSRPTPTP